MNPKLTTLVLAVALLLSGCETAGARRQRDIAASWEKFVTADVEVVGYEKGAPDAFLGVTWGSLCAQLYPSNISKVKVLPPSDYAGEIYSISIPDAVVRDFDPAPWRQPGKRFHIKLSLVYLKYRPWGFIPYDSVQQPSELGPLSTAASP